MSAVFDPPAGYGRVGVVDSFEALVGASFGPTVNALCWPRVLQGDFDEVAACFSAEEDVFTLTAENLRTLRPRLSPRGWIAVEEMMEDQRRMHGLGLLPALECVPRYMRDADSTVPTDVYSFHADRAPVEADTYLCSYNEAATEALRNEAAMRRVDIPETRAALYDAFIKEGGRDGTDDFDDYLAQNCYDLHYAPQTGAVPFSFGLGNLWRIAIAYPGCPVPPCVHRAPETVAGRLPRLLLIS